MHLNGFLAFGDSCFKVALSYACRRLIGADIHRKNLVEVVLMAFTLCLKAIEISHFTIVKCIVMSS